MAGAVLGGLRWSLTEILLRKESLGLSNPCASIFYLAPVQGIVLIVISGIVEGYFNIFRSAFFLTFQEGIHTVSNSYCIENNLGAILNGLPI
jgi:solute carrier family 35 protein C2